MSAVNDNFTIQGLCDDLAMARSIIERLLRHCDRLYNDSHDWRNEDGEKCDVPWQYAECFGLDHDLHDDIEAYVWGWPHGSSVG